MRRVHFVCTGNICRSPMAEYLLQHKLKEKGVDDVFCESSGVMGLEGVKAAGGAINVLSRKGIDLTPHRGRGLTKTMLEEAGLVVAMEQMHATMAKDLYPGAGEKTVMLSDYLKGREGMDIPDPYGRDQIYFDKTYTLVNEATELMAEKIKNGDILSLDQGE